MNIWTPYTKDALTRIKNGATAADLGWDDLFYARVCREHGLPRNDIKLVKTHTPPEIAATPSISCAQAKCAKKTKPATTTAVLDDDVPPEYKGWVLNLTSRRLRLGAAMVNIARQQLEVLRWINKGAPDAPINGRLIAQRLGLDPKTENVGGAVATLRIKLQHLGLLIKSRKAKENSGYWLADAKDDSPVRLRITSSHRVAKP